MESDWNVKRKISSCKTVRETSELKFANFILEHSSQSKEYLSVDQLLDTTAYVPD